MKRIKTPAQLFKAAAERRSVIGVGASPKPFPAAFVLNMNFAQVSHAMERGYLKVYKPKHTRK